jgi:hypothetical protein
MKPVHSFLSLFVLSSMVAAQALAPQPVLKIELQPAVASFHVSGPAGVFLGGVILSLSGDRVHYFQGLPPLLADFVVLGVGAVSGEYVVSIPQSSLPPGVMIYAQGVTADIALLSTEVGSLMIPR